MDCFTNLTCISFY